MRFASSCRDRWRVGAVLVVACATAGLAAVDLACATECDAIPIERGEYVGVDDPQGTLMDAGLTVQDDLVIVEYREGGVSYLVELRRTAPQ